jgi:hypothetical protein
MARRKHRALLLRLRELAQRSRTEDARFLQEVSRCRDTLEAGSVLSRALAASLSDHPGQQEHLGPPVSWVHPIV